MHESEQSNTEHKANLEGKAHRSQGGYPYVVQYAKHLTLFRNLQPFPS